MPTLFCLQGGLPEDPGFHWERMGEAEGASTMEVANNLAVKDPDFAKYYDPARVTYWGWMLSIKPNEEPG